MKYLSLPKLSTSKLSRLRHWSLVAATVLMLGLITNSFHFHLDVNDAGDCLVCQQRIDQDDGPLSAVFLPPSAYAVQLSALIDKTLVLCGLTRALLSIRAPPVLLLA
jgi:hypothetical protein